MSYVTGSNYVICARHGVYNCVRRWACSKIKIAKVAGWNANDVAKIVDIICDQKIVKSRVAIG